MTKAIHKFKHNMLVEKEPMTPKTIFLLNTLKPS